MTHFLASHEKMRQISHFWMATMVARALMHYSIRSCGIEICSIALPQTKEIR
jgi:hypothetical protein